MIWVPKASVEMDLPVTYVRADDRASVTLYKVSGNVETALSGNVMRMPDDGTLSGDLWTATLRVKVTGDGGTNTYDINLSTELMAYDAPIVFWGRHGLINYEPVPDPAPGGPAPFAEDLVFDEDASGHWGAVITTAADERAEIIPMGDRSVSEVAACFAGEWSSRVATLQNGATLQITQDSSRLWLNFGTGEASGDYGIITMNFAFEDLPIASGYDFIFNRYYEPTA